ncbi:GNAT family N-acetyltransferase [Peptococcaceae bacterium 1198_IL3148]
MSLNVYQVKNQYQFDIFLNMSQTIYYDDPFWPAPPPSETAQQLLNIPRKDVNLYVAVNNNAVIGRVAGMLNNTLADKNTAIFGYFECINDPNAASALMKAVESWANDKGCRYLTGPVCYNTNDSIGILVDGFHLPPQFGMPYNHYYYQTLLEQSGYHKYFDLLAYRWSANHPMPEKLKRIAKGAQKTPGLVLRPFNLHFPKREAQILVKVHNQTMEGNWGAETLTVSDAIHYLNSYRSFADPDLLLTVIINGEPAGICLTIPNLSAKYHSCRVAVLGVVPKFRTKGIAALLIYETMLRLIKKGYQEAELSLIMENNTMMNRILRDTLKFDIIKRFRVYRKEL